MKNLKKKVRIRIHLKSKHLLVIMTIFCASCIVATFASGVTTVPLQEAAGIIIVPFENSINHISSVFSGISDRMKDKEEIRKRYNLQLGTRTAKRLKMVMGRLSDQRKGVRKVVGIDCISGLPREEVISSYVVNDGIMNCVNEIASEMKTFLERIPPQISYHIAKQGIYITGGSTRLPYLDKYLASYTGFTFNMSDLYEKSAVSGLEKIIKNKELRKWAMPVKQRKL